VHYGAERIGASVIPTSTGNTHRQLKVDPRRVAEIFPAIEGHLPTYRLLISRGMTRNGGAAKAGL
jgi:phenylacetate-coenzyme A ligase PaaK-like adenylate-forming protein